MLKKSIEMKEVKVSFVSLVDRPANKRQFLIAKGENGVEKQIPTEHRIIKRDDEQHYLTGIVYEPMKKDAHDNFMTAEEIAKAAHWYAKFGNNVDRQHDFEPLEKVRVVESYIVPVDMTIGEELVTKGTWVMVVEVEDSEIWDAVVKGEITGFSLAGTAILGDEDVELEESESEKKSLFEKFAKLCGYEVVKKGEFADKMKRHTKVQNFFMAFDVLRDVLTLGTVWDCDGPVFQTDGTKLREALDEFKGCIEALLLEGDIVKSLQSIPANKFMKADFQNSRQFNQNNNESEVDNMTPEQLKQITDSVTEGIMKALNPNPNPNPEPTPATPLTEDAVKEIVKAAIADNNKEIGTQIGEAVSKAIQPILTANGLSTQPEDDVRKSDEGHWMNQILI